MDLVPTGLNYVGFFYCEIILHLTSSVVNRVNPEVIQAIGHMECLTRNVSPREILS